MLPVSRGRLISATLWVAGSTLTTIIVSVLKVASFARPESTPTSRIFMRSAQSVQGGTVGPDVSVGAAVGPGVVPGTSLWMGPCSAELHIRSGSRRVRACPGGP